LADETKLGIATIPIRATLDQLDKDLSGAKTKAQSGVNEINSIFGKIGLGTIAAGAAVAGFTKFMGDAVEMAREAEKIQANLNATLASTKGVAGLTADEINDMAASLSQVTVYEDDVIVEAQAMMLTFTQIGKEIFPQATETALNMADKFGSLDSAVLQLGKALNDPILGVTALRRVGIQLTEAQEEQIKSFVESGDILSAQKVILGELETQFGGLARAIGETSEGKLTILQNNLANTQEAIGTGLLPVIGQLTDKFSALLSPLVSSNEQLTSLTSIVAEFEATPLLAALDNAAFVMNQVNAVTSWLNDLLSRLQERLGITSEKTEDMGAQFKAVMLPITMLTQGPLAAMRDVMDIIADLIDRINGFSPGQVLTDLRNIGGAIGLQLADGGMVPGPIGQPQLAVVHGGEMVIPAGDVMELTTNHFYNLTTQSNVPSQGVAQDFYMMRALARA
jgi:hypothetical protein